MSWAITTQGTQDEARQAVEADPHVPPHVKQAISTALGAFAPEASVELHTNGHIEPTAKTGNATIQITTV